MIVVTTPTGQIGSRLVRELRERGENVRVIARTPDALDPEVRESVEVVAGSHADPAVLDAALAGADALFWLVPPGRSAAGALAYYLDFTEPAVAAIRRHGVGHVVGVTSAGHGYARPAGVLSAAFAMDERLAASGAAYRALSLPFYLENLLGQAEGIRERGVFSLAAPGDRPFATVATSDVAVEAAELLTARDWSGREDVPLFGPDRLTLEQLAAVMSEELGRTVAYRPMSIDELASAMRAGGATEQAVRDTTEMFAAQVDGIYDADWARAKTGATDVRSWCRTVLARRV